jgi:hypothetical protein
MHVVLKVLHLHPPARLSHGIGRPLSSFYRFFRLDLGVLFVKAAKVVLLGTGHGRVDYSESH